MARHVPHILVERAVEVIKLEHKLSLTTRDVHNLLWKGSNCHYMHLLKESRQTGKVKRVFYLSHNWNFTSSTNWASLANWLDDDELDRRDPVRVPLPKPDTNRDVGAEPLLASVCTAKFCWLVGDLLTVSLELSSSILDVNSSILSFNVNICSDNWLIIPYKSNQMHQVKRFWKKKKNPAIQEL